MRLERRLIVWQTIVMILRVKIETLVTLELADLNVKTFQMNFLFQLLMEPLYEICTSLSCTRSMVYVKY